jgi:peptidoglycan hydrolase-like protein with peptidoglycan-binding domain
MNVRITILALVLAGASGAFADDALYVDSGTVREVQKELRDRGQRIGIDGVMGPRTQAALRQFQKAENLVPTGRLDRRTLVALGVQPNASAGASEPNSGPEDYLRRAQQTLNHRGYQAGPANGQMNPKTRRALRDFQQSEDLEVTGRLNDDTLAALGISRVQPVKTQ